MAIFLKRDTKVYLKKTVGAVSAIWEIPVLDGFSFSQANTTSEVTLNEMESATGFSKRGRRAFNDALAPAEWSLSTYVRPFTSATAYSASATNGTGAGGVNNVFAVEEQLWANFVGKGGWTTSATGVGTFTLVAAGLTYNGTPIFYDIDQGESTTTSSGFGATFRVEVTGAATANVTVINPGSGYSITAPNDKITIPGSALGGTGSIVLTVTGLTSATTVYTPNDIDNFIRGTDNLNINFAGSGVGTLGTFDLFFVMGATSATSLNYTSSSTLEIFKLSNCVVNEATVNFEVDGISMIDWSGNASTIATEATFDARAAITEGITLTNNFIRNKITALSLVSNNGVTRLAYPGNLTGNPVPIANLIAGRTYEITVVGTGTPNWTSIGASAATAGTRFIYNGVVGTGTSSTATELAGSYNITLTGGSITFSNNVTYLTPETLGIVNQPIGHITGNKSVSGNFTAYVDFGLANDSGALFDGATSTTARSIVTNSFSLAFRIGGTATNTPRLEIALPTAHLEIPTIQTEDVIAIDVAFSGLPSSITSNDEATLTYRPFVA